MSDYTSDDITEMCDTWANYNGFAGDSCGRCGTTANVLAGGAGWLCERCGHYNVQSFSDFRMPHEHPDYGPTRDVITAGHKASKKWAELLK